MTQHSKSFKQTKNKIKSFFVFAEFVMSHHVLYIHVSVLYCACASPDIPIRNKLISCATSYDAISFKCLERKYA